MYIQIQKLSNQFFKVFKQIYKPVLPVLSKSNFMNNFYIGINCAIECNFIFYFLSVKKKFTQSIEV